ncbi:FAD-dependent oxidoreductase [Polaromonas sp. LjRoot131]|uniref:FAD-dependent oxidoreductase n=1 Tax=Polaromonas sp. LjRoot131 TaxID=3342262 RepID=UPI003ECC8B9C
MNAKNPSTAIEYCDVLIIGAGPAGLAAALAAAPSGARITLLDDNPAPGGQIWRDGPGAHLPPQALRLREALARCANVRLLCGTRVVSPAGAGALLLEDATQGWVQPYDKLILCTGARELLLPFPGWTLPGVTGAGGLQALVKAGLPVAGERIVIAGSGPLLLVAAATARQAGARVLRIAEQAGLASVAGFAAQLLRWPGKATQALGLASARYRTGTRIVSAQGAGRVESVRLQHAGRETEIACERVACGFGLVPNTELGQLLGCALTPDHGGARALAVDGLQATSVAGVYAAGECTGVGGSERALAQGRIAGHAAVENTGAAHHHSPERAHWQAFADQLQRHFTLAPSLKTLARPDTLVCRCEDVPQAALAACGSWTEAKLHTRCGMGACQGRVCGAAAHVLFGWTPPAPRPPLSPARIATLASTPTD